MIYEETSWHNEVNDEELRAYLLTWLMMYGRKWCSVEEAIEVDRMIDEEDDEDCWSVALEHDYLMNKYDSKTGDDYWRISAKGMKFIKQVNEGSHIPMKQEK